MYFSSQWQNLSESWASFQKVVRSLGTSDKQDLIYSARTIFIKQRPSATLKHCPITGAKQEYKYLSSDLSRELDSKEHY